MRAVVIFVLGTSLKVENAVLCFANDRICVVSTPGRGHKVREANYSPL